MSRSLAVEAEQGLVVHKEALPQQDMQASDSRSAGAHAPTPATAAAILKSSGRADNIAPSSARSQ